jgi:peptidoglycan/xylan/chitin deacetylase (PgdA/CDA1 family)
MKLVQCWDDGVTTDARLTELLRRHGARASFNLNAGLHQVQRMPGWVHEGTEVWRLGWSEMRSVYAGFTIANHSLRHPCLTDLPIAELRREIVEGREQLQQFFGQAVDGFVYPFGAFNAAVMDAVRDAGHVYARTTQDADASLGGLLDPLALHPACHFLAPDFWQRHEQARSRGVFHFWGHSYEMCTEAHWAAYEATLTRLNSDPRDHWCEVAEGAAILDSNPA